jgi:hypothetical protein
MRRKSLFPAIHESATKSKLSENSYINYHGYKAWILAIARDLWPSLLVITYQRRAGSKCHDSDGST